jgi:hypothetical protein
MSASAAASSGSVAALRAGQVAVAVGVNVETLRYYERRGLLAEPDRSPGGHRLYPAETVTVLRVIKAAQRLGFSAPIARLRAGAALPQASIRSRPARMTSAGALRLRRSSFRVRERPTFVDDPLWARGELNPHVLSDTRT